jgi:hypothetical protein
MNNLTQEQVSECEAGCKHFMCGSVGHIKECVNYKDSMQEMIDIKNSRIQELEKQLAETENCRKIACDLLKDWEAGRIISQTTKKQLQEKAK